MEKKSNNQEGYVVLIVTFFVMIIMLGMALSMSFLIANRQKSIANTVKSTQSYYAAEAGIEDALLRLKKTPQISSLSYSLNVANAIVSVDIPGTIGISKSLTSQANNAGMFTNVKTICSMDNTQSASFHYGVEVGEGGLIMGNGSEIMGNVFSGGNISGSGTIDNDAVVSGNGHSINGVTVKGNAFVYSCLSGARINGDLTYVQGGSHTCTVDGATNMQTQEISQQPLPIPQSQIDNWKSEASTVCSSLEVSKLSGNNKTVSLGPCKIVGDLTFGNGDVLTLTGTVYVTGNINLGQHNSINLSSSYGSLGGALVADGAINTGTNNIFSGSGQTGSYVLIISTNSSDSAISVNNNSSGAVFYASAGAVIISNNVSVIEATGYKVIMNSNSKIQYSAGVVNIYFTSGPGGGWKVTSWQEY